MAKLSLKRNLQGSLYRTMAGMIVLPMVLLSFIISIFCSRNYIHMMYHEVMESLKSTCQLVEAAYDGMYPGDYVLEGEDVKVLKKGDTVISGDNTIVDQIKEKTGVDVALFYYDTKILTTLTNREGKRIVGTGCSLIVMRDVYEGKEAHFYPKVKVNDELYFSYYEPLYNSDGTCIGMLFAGKPSAYVEKAIIKSIIPLILIIIAATIITGYFSFLWSSKLASHITLIQKFLTSVSQGNLSEELNPVILKRDDELGMMGKSVLKMQHNLRELIEKDALTGLHNRRFGDMKLQEIQEKAKVNGMPFCVAIGDIDFFKKVNDTKGHDCGDLVLKKIANLLKNQMIGKGFAARWGGEEFLIVYHGLHLTEAKECLEKMLEQIRELEIPYGETPVKITMTFGIEEGNLEEDTDHLVKKADDKLYYGKENGRNQVVC